MTRNRGIINPLTEEIDRFRLPRYLVFAGKTPYWWLKIPNEVLLATLRKDALLRDCHENGKIYFIAMKPMQKKLFMQSFSKDNRGFLREHKLDMSKCPPRIAERVEKAFILNREENGKDGTDVSRYVLNQEEREEKENEFFDYHGIEH